MLEENILGENQSKLYLVKLVMAEEPFGSGAINSQFVLYEEGNEEYKVVNQADTLEELTSSVDPNRISYDPPKELLITSFSYNPEKGRVNLTYIDRKKVNNVNDKNNEEKPIELQVAFLDKLKNSVKRLVDSAFDSIFPSYSKFYSPEKA